MANKNKIRRAFTLIELIVGVTISVLLMVSIGVFVSSGMQNMFSIQRIVTNLTETSSFIENLNENIFNISDKSKIRIVDSNTIIFKRNKYADKGGFTYISMVDKPLFCDGDVDNPDTTHIFIKSFVPFDGIREVNFKGKNYKTVDKENKIVDENGETLVGRDIFGDELYEDEDAKKSYLNSPTGLATDGEVLYISDTLNNRILYLRDGKLFKLLDEMSGLKEPTGLYYDTTDKALLIANSSAGKILKYSSPAIAIPSDFELKFTGIHESNISKIEIKIYRNEELLDLNPSIEVSNFSFTTLGKHEKSITNKTLTYDFKKEIPCTPDEEGGTCTPEIVPETFSFSSNQTYTINISQIDDYIESGNYFIQLKIGNTEIEKYFFTKGDEKLYTTGDNVLEVVQSGLEYPNGLWGENSYSEFKISDNHALEFDIKSDIYLKTPIKSFEISNDKGDLINIILKTYKDYDCYNPDESKNKTETFVSKISLK